MSEPPEMDAPVTRREMHDALGHWAGAITAQVTAQVTAQIIAQVKALLEALESRLMAELRGQVRGSEVELATRLVAVDEQYKDLPPRVTRLEAKVFASPKRKRRSPTRSR